MGRALHTTYDISYEQIYGRNEPAAKLLQLWGYLDKRDLWFGLLAAESDCSPKWFLSLISEEVNFYEAIRLLCNHALIESEGFSGGYSMHSCVHDWAMFALNSEEEISMAELALRCVGSAVPDKTVFQYWEIQRRLLPHANRCLESTLRSPLSNSRNTEHILNSAHKIGNLYSDQGMTKEANQTYLWVLTEKEKVLGARHSSTLDTVNNLGNLYSNQGKFKEAEDLYLRALVGYEKIWDAEHPSTLDTVNHLGLLYSNQGKLKEAEDMYFRALAGYEKVWGAEHLSTLDTVHNGFCIRIKAN